MTFSQVSFCPGGFADNPEPRCPCLLLLDTSGSMQGAPIAELNAGLASFRDQLIADDLALKRVEVGVITFGPVRMHTPFTTANHFHPTDLTAGGETPMGDAIRKGMAMLRARKDDYRANGISFYRPWMFLITDGQPTDEWLSAAAAVRAGEDSKSLAFFAVGVQDANMEILRAIAVREPLRLQGLRFRELFQWLSNSMRSISRSTPGSGLALPPPSGWASV